MVTKDTVVWATWCTKEGEEIKEEEEEEEEKRKEKEKDEQGEGIEWKE